MKSKNHLEIIQKKEEKRILEKIPTQNKAPGQIQGMSKHLKQNNGQGRGQRVKAGTKEMTK
jgi:hypothetical protein